MPLTLSAPLTAQHTLTTLFASNNNGAAGGATYFDLTVSQTVSISAFDANFTEAPGASAGMMVYTTPMTYVGNEGSMAAWTLAGQDNGMGMAAGVDSPTRITMQSPVVLTPGTYGIALVAVGVSHAYTNGSGANQTYMSTGLTLQAGAATNIPFDGSPFTPRVWNGTIYYSEGINRCTAYTTSDNDNQLRLIELSTGATLSSLNVTTSSATVLGVHGLAQNDTATYALLSTVVTAGGLPNSDLATIDLNTGMATIIGNLGDAFDSIAFGSSGLLFGVTRDDANTPETLFAIDTATAATTQVMSLGTGSDGEVLCWHPGYKGVLHASGRDGLLNDPTNGPNLGVLSPERGRAKGLRLSGHASDEITAMAALPNRAIFAATADSEFVTIDKKGVITQFAMGDHVPSAILFANPAGTSMSGKLGLKLRFDQTDLDSVGFKLKGVDLGPSFTAAGADVSFELGTLDSLTVTLDESGRYKDQDVKIAFKQSSRDGTWSIGFKAKNADLSELSTLGFTNAEQNVRLPLCLSIASGAARASTMFVLSYKAKLDRGGSAK